MKRKAPILEHELGCANGHGVVLRDGRAWCDACGGFVEAPTRTGRTRRQQFVFGKYPQAEPFR